MENKIVGFCQENTLNFRAVKEDGRICYSYSCKADAVYGLGERYCGVNHKGKKLVNRVFEQFTKQGEHTYFPLPFYYASDGHGVFVDTLSEVTFSFEEEENRIELSEEAEHTVFFYYGGLREILPQFTKTTGRAILPPKWAFGVWASANRWNSQEIVEKQLVLMEEKEYPVSVVVLEAWSDEATFYIWNGAQYSSCAGEEGFCLKDFTFFEPWPDPAAMIRKIHDQGRKLILWQIPALKLLEEGRQVRQHELDCAYAEEQKLVVLEKSNGEEAKPYRIPKQWFIGSMVPDFSNPQTVAFWEKKRRYLIDEMQVDGFKTDGGEFIHDKEVTFYAGYDGSSGKNAYPALYEAAYQSMIGENRVLFSRAGYLGSQKTPMHWAGDQVSDFSELKAVLSAGLSLSLSGVFFWSFDIGGFAGPLPTPELYLRATALGAFVPAMQWHSEPAGGQFEEIMKAAGGINDRSPWNLEAVYSDSDLMNKARFLANLHMNLLPYFYSEAQRAVRDGIPFLRPLVLDYEADEKARLCEDEYRIGDLLIAPVLTEGAAGRVVYLPQGSWYDFWTGEKIEGGVCVEKEAKPGMIPCYLRAEGAVLLNLGCTLKIGGKVSGTGAYENLYLIHTEQVGEVLLYGENGEKYRLQSPSDQLAGLPVTWISMEGADYQEYFDRKK